MLVIITRSVMATLHACRRFATPNYLTPEPQIEIWGYRLSSLRDYTKSEIGNRRSEIRLQGIGFGGKRRSEWEGTDCRGLGSDCRS